MTVAIADDENAIDSGVETLINTCLDLSNPTSFFLYAGAGSGKTRSLVNAIDRLRVEFKRQLLLRSQRIAVITYTNAARDEIKQRLEFDPLVEVSTIHSFAWSLINGFNTDIRAWLRDSLRNEITELKAALAKGRSSTKAARDRELSIANKYRRLDSIESSWSFIYSPTGDNRTRDALNHNEVISIASDFLKEKTTLQDVLVSQYPVLFIDESQDTNRHLMDAFLTLQQVHKQRFCLGLFGDTMQRIYSDGKVRLAEAIPDDWARPEKQMNHRCAHRIIRLINRIRSEVDDQKQLGRADKPEGVVRLFIVSTAIDNRFDIETDVAQRMAEIADDESWKAGQRGYKTLILEHHMAARRMGFYEMFEPLYKISRFRTGLLDGSLAGIQFFANDVLPVVEAMRQGDQFAVASIVRNRSPLLMEEALRSAGADQIGQLKKARLAVEDLMQLWKHEVEPTFLDVLLCISRTGLFFIPEALQLIVQSDGADNQPTGIDDEEDEMEAWRQCIATPFKQTSGYAEYINGTSPFGTHQGIKGREFPRVMVIISDEEARGFLFSYKKLFGAKEKSANDLKNESEGTETTIDRTRRLFYVTCSRAKSSLAIVAYSDHPESVRERVIRDGWFDKNEIEFLEG